ncbi:cytokine receptor-like factor 2 isoform X1 [Osmerus mordax]|uniref:cytokine receptor-like factor 2 isoform X1 n=1 Tax=Osmerus mordax TaxID=8014 RepID=UPI00350F1CC2
MCASVLLSLLLVCSFPQTGDTTRPAINPDNIRLNVSRSSKGLQVSWQYPRPDQDERCYETQLQHNTSCHTDWQTVTLQDRDFLLESPSWGRSYTFRVRMKHINICPAPHQWSAWTPPVYWGPEAHTVSCDVEAKSPINTSTYIGTIIPLSLCFLLVCIFSQTRIRVIFLPHIPSPKHACGSLTINHSQWRGGFSVPGVDCEMVDVEIVSIQNTEEEEEAKEKEEGENAEKEKEEEGNRNEECSVFDQGLCPTDAGLQIYPSLAANGAYCSLCLWDERNASLNMVV